MMTEKDQERYKPPFFRRERHVTKKTDIAFLLAGDQKVHLYEPLQRHDMNARLHDSWKEVREMKW